MAHDPLEMIEYRDEPAILIFGDSEKALDSGRRAAGLAGCRVVAAGPIETAVEQLERASADAVLVEQTGGKESGGLVALLDWLEAHHRRAVVVAPAELIDLVASRITNSDITHMCGPTEAELVQALGLASRPEPARLHDVGREGHALLHQLSQEVGRIANILASLSEEEAEGLATARAAAEREKDEPPLDPTYLRALIRARRLRDQYFRPELFADPAWDMLLDLMAARLEKNRVAVSSLCIAAAVPATTALRWIKALTDQGLFVRQADPQDGRRVYIELSDETARALNAYLRAVQRIAPTVI